MRSGGMRHTIEIWSNTSSRNEYGELVNEWVKVKVAKAQVTKVSGNTQLQNSQAFASMSIKISVWDHHNITESNRIKWDGNMYSINFIEPSFDSRKQILICQRIA